LNDLVRCVASGCSRGRTALVVDDTGSMGGEIDGVKIALASFIDQGITLENRDWTLFTFKDDVTDRGTTASRAQIKSEVNAIFPGGGDDCPEESIGAL
jgi:uncharacterized protein with von Willebrand factor type A (vWA) domain